MRVDIRDMLVGTLVRHESTASVWVITSQADDRTYGRCVEGGSRWLAVCEELLLNIGSGHEWTLAEDEFAVWVREIRVEAGVADGNRS